MKNECKKKIKLDLFFYKCLLNLTLSKRKSGRLPPLFPQQTTKITLRTLHFQKPIKSNIKSPKIRDCKVKCFTFYSDDCFILRTGRNTIGLLGGLNCNDLICPETYLPWNFQLYKLTFKIKYIVGN